MWLSDNHSYTVAICRLCVCRQCVYYCLQVTVFNAASNFIGMYLCNRNIHIKYEANDPVILHLLAVFVFFSPIIFIEAWDFLNTCIYVHMHEFLWYLSFLHVACTIVPFFTFMPITLESWSQSSRLVHMFLC